MNDVVAKHQHVPVADWFLTGVAGNETTVVNLYPSGVTVVSLFFFCAESGAVNRLSATTVKSKFFIFVLLLIHDWVQVKNIQNIRSEKCF
jgi:hypothetical protein